MFPGRPQVRQKTDTAISQFEALIDLSVAVIETVALSNKYHQGNTAQRLAKRTLKVLDELRWELENKRARLGTMTPPAP